MNKFRVQRFQTTVTIPVNNDTEDAPALVAPTDQLNGLLKGITLVAPALTGTAYTVSILGQRGEVLFTKAGIVEAITTHINQDSNNRPLEVPISIRGVSPVRIKSTGSPDATGVLTFANNGALTDGKTVTIGDQVYRLKLALAQANDVLIEPDVKATGTITSDETNPANGGNVVVDDQTYVFKTALTEAKAAGIVKSVANGIPVDGETTTVGARVYRYKDILAQVDDVKIGATGEATLNNLRAAINLTGTEGVEYFAGQTIHPDVTAPSAASLNVADYDLALQAKVIGVAGNSIVLTESATNITVSGTGTLENGVDAIANEVLIDGGGNADTTLTNLKKAINGESGEGTNYSTGTAQPTSGVTSSAVASHALTLTHPTDGPSGNATVFTATATHITLSGSGTLTNGAWSGDATLTNLLDALTLEDGSGQSGVKYHAGTTANEYVTGAPVAAHALTVTAVEAVDDPADVDTLTNEARLSWGAATLVGGGEAGARVFSVDLLIDRG